MLANIIVVPSIDKHPDFHHLSLLFRIQLRFLPFSKLGLIPACAQHHTCIRNQRSMALWYKRAWDWTGWTKQPVDRHVRTHKDTHILTHSHTHILKFSHTQSHHTYTQTNRRPHRKAAGALQKHLSATTAAPTINCQKVNVAYSQFKQILMNKFIYKFICFSA